MVVLVDTSVWVNHFRQGDKALTNLIETDLALIHPLVIGEIACGTPPEPRQQTLADLALLKRANEATLPEVMSFIEREKLFDLGCGIVDMVLLASTLLTPNARLWTGDKRLAVLAERFNVRFEANVH
ncbi:MAG: VapC toxin family PIN domain ribonuclease [Rhodocyclaceae bacterium]|nr:VapC toxin family PIN domain ribonuclease [Rhodocyclaceae bacterium]MCE2723169.1 VapC toxin family PIN domain ribonuclease [Betaproteobacteria bacterium]MCA3022101.1 VapC toxin family PIN domain ribonuclease [Rhodocyclaceae bacterium]MCA3029841.1 VapC toxin family PIN domain ribonuclease [Rhodocyclaceae bacterium]MCA3034327.1 VapC toxin family PIN domain ribonuclease [Rhodocyclaceae bacterium]